MITVVFKTRTGGELDHREVKTPAEAAAAAIAMISEAGELNPGDIFEIHGHEED